MGLGEKVGDLHVEDGGKEYVIREVEAFKAMGALITKEADSMSSMKFRINKPCGWTCNSTRTKELLKETQKVPRGGAIVYSALK